MKVVKLRNVFNVSDSWQIARLLGRAWNFPAPAYIEIIQRVFYTRSFTRFFFMKMSFANNC